MSDTILYVTEVECQGVRSTVLVNDVPVFTEFRGSPRIFQTKVNQYIRQGTNRLDVLVAPLVDRHGRPLITGERTLRASLIKGVWGIEPGPDGVQLVLDANAEPDRLSRRALLRVSSAEFEVPEVWGPWAFQSAPDTPVTPQDRARIAVALAEAHRALAEGNVATLSRVFAHKNDELARALDVPRDEVERDQTEYFLGFFRQRGWSMEPFDPDDMVLERVAYGRAVLVTTRDGSPILRGRAGEDVFVLRPILSRIDGAWTIVR